MNFSRRGATQAHDVGQIARLIMIAGLTLTSLAEGATGDGISPTGSRELPPLDQGPSPVDLRRSTGTVNIKYRGTPAAGSRITVGLDTQTAPGTTFRWAQVEGPTVVLDDTTRPSISFNVPAGATKLGFALTLGEPSGEKTVRFDVPIRGPADDPPTATAPTGLVADAGDDQVGLVGHRTTLNGSSRGDSDKTSYRWFQLGGPKVERASQDRAYYTFTPSAPGIYRFGLIAATPSGDSAPTISEPDEVIVTVGSPPGSESAGGSAAPAIEQAGRAARALASPEGLEQLAATFEAIAERASIYKAFGEMSSEMMRRLESVIPAEPNARQVWVQTIFNPLTQQITAEMRAVGLDLAQPQGLYQELNSTQKDRLRALFAQFARQIRSNAPPR